MNTLSSISVSSSFRPLFPMKSPFRFPSITLHPPKPIDSFVPKATAEKHDPKLLDRRDLLRIGVGGVCAAAAAATASLSAAADAAAGGDYPIKLDGVVRRVVGRPRKSRSKKEKEEEEEVLVIEGIEFDRSLPVKLDVYVNDDGGAGPDALEFAGSLVNVPHRQRSGKGKNLKTSLRLGITDLLEGVGADDDDTLVVTLVPKSGKGVITIGKIGIEFLAA